MRALVLCLLLAGCTDHMLATANPTCIAFCITIIKQADVTTTPEEYP